MQEVFGCLGQPIYGYLRDIPDLLIGMKTIRLLPIVTKFMAGQPTPTGKKKLQQMVVVVFMVMLYHTHTIHVWYIYLHLVVFNGKIW